MAPNISRRVRPENLRVKQPITRKAASRAAVVTMLVSFLEQTLQPAWHPRVNLIEDDAFNAEILQLVSCSTDK